MALLDNVIKIAEGQNSTVFLQKNEESYGHPVILKILKDEYNYYPHTTQIANEDSLIRELGIQGVRGSLDLLEVGSQMVLVLDFFEGKTLKQLVNTSKRGFTDNLKLAIRIADVLSQIHEKNIIHRDLSSNNILVNNNNEISIIDFGLATKVNMKQDLIGISESLEGTLPYISPEQTGRVNHVVDHRSDLYSFGVVLYELFTGMLPFNSDDPMEIVHCHLAVNPEPLTSHNSDIPKVFSDIVLKLLSKDLESRYQSANGIKSDLEKCLSQVETKIEISEFKLASEDLGGRFLIPSKLYGRGKQIAALLESFDQLGNSKEVSLIEGHSGIGKTSLVYEIHKPITEKKGNFLSGKHEQFNKDLPYQALAQAIDGFVSLLLSETESRLAYWRKIISEALGNEGKLITDLVPNLEIIIGKQPELEELGLNEMQNRFIYTFTKFIRCLSSKNHPMVLFIDDLQWADYASLHLIKELIQDPELRYFYFIGAYRDNEIDPTHPTAIVFNELEKSNVGINYIKLRELEFADLEMMLSDTFGCSTQEASSLAEVVHAKTAGNPFFINQFIQTIHEESLVTFDRGTNKWTWDLEGLDQMNFTDNVVEFMIQKIGKLGSQSQEILKFAACIGDKFDLQTLSLVSGLGKEQLLDPLWTVISEQYLLVKEKHPDLNHLKISAEEAANTLIQYQFAHDRIRQASYSLIPDDEKSSVHGKIGMLLLENLPVEERHERVFEIVHQLNQSDQKLDKANQKILAELNYEAGEKAKSSTAYEAALGYFEIASSNASSELWNSNYDLIFNLNLGYMECAYLVGNYDLMNQLSSQLLKNTKSRVDEMKVKNIIIFSLIAQNKHIELIEYGLKVLKGAGINLPKNPQDTHILIALVQTKIKLRGKNPDFFANLPFSDNEEMKLAINIMASVSTGSYHNLPKLFPIVILKSMRLALKHGNTIDIISFYGGYASILCGVTGEYQLGYDFAKMSLRLLDEHKGTKQFRPRTNVIFAAFINHWKDHLKESIPYLKEAYLVAMETGDSQYAASAIFLESYKAFWIGTNLTSLVPDLLNFEKRARGLKQEAYALYTRITLQGFLNISNEMEDPAILDGEIFDEAAFLGDIDNELNKDKTALFHIHFSKLYLNFLFGNYEEAFDGGTKAKDYLEVVLAAYYIPLYHFFMGLTEASLATKNGNNTKYLKSVKKHLKKLKKWAEHAPMNYKNKYELVLAESLAAENKFDEALIAYDQSIDSAKEFGYTNELAMAYEQKAKLLARIGNSEAESEALSKTYLYYKQWGALAKTSRLEAEYPYLLNDNPNDPMLTQSRSFTSRSIGNKLLDLSTILKAASTISSEIQLRRVIPKLLRIVIENAGAQSGSFILIEGEKLLVHAVGDKDNDVKMIDPKPVSEVNDLSESIINYVYRSKEHVVLEQATENKKFGNDEYIKTNNVQSVLCLPILHQGQYLGIIYLENNLIKGAFTIQRLDLLTMLSGQIAVTLNNALLYDNLEQKVEERTHQIEEQKEQLNKQNIELKSINDEKDYLVSLVSHDLRTPLYGIRSFAGLAARKLKDEKTKDYTEPIIETIDRLDSMITRILDISAINAKQVKLELEEFDVSQTVEEITNNHLPMAQDKSIDLKVDRNGSLILRLDKNYLIQILDNLISNAIKYSHPEKQVMVSMKKVEEGVQIAVKDSGPGISKRDQRLLFNNFQKLSAEPTAGEKSTGLGLSIVKKYVDSMNGKVWCESELEKGSTFFVELRSIK
jgi:predicted ATPase/signal transduction histidine kinase/tRNA A-37 threonylcarbamoyl transferase component Bud32